GDGGVGEGGRVGLLGLAVHGAAGGGLDVRDLLERVDGSSLAEAPAIPVHVTALLPEEADGTLIEGAGPGRLRLGGYRAALIVVAAAWLSPLAYVAARRWRRRRAGEGGGAPGGAAAGGPWGPPVGAADRRGPR